MDKSMGVVIDQANVWKSAMEGLEKKLQETHQLLSGARFNPLLSLLDHF